jgi:8-amino-7-oxononanoate synthase
MDGDEAPLAEIHALCRTHDALLLVDEAHALGVFGPHGRGRCAELGIVPDLVIGTCSKSFGAQGGFLAGDRDLIELVVNRGRAFIFSTAPVPAAVGAALGALELMTGNPDWPTELQTKAAALRTALRAQGWAVPEGRSPIIPLVVGSDADAVELAGKLRAAGHYAPAIRPPTVPEGACRLRLTLTLAHREADIRRLLQALAALRSTVTAALERATCSAVTSDGLPAASPDARSSDR